jgi:hypothetical protein
MSLERIGASDGETLSRALLEPERADLGRDARRFFAGLSLASLFGLALGLRFGLASMAAHAIGVPLGILAVTLLCTPAFFVGVLHGGFDLDARSLASTIAFGMAAAGLVLAGLSPAMALFSFSAESVYSIGALAALGLVVAGFLGQRATFRAWPEEAGLRGGRFFLFRWSFSLFAAVLALRVWWLALPIYGEWQ